MKNDSIKLLFIGPLPPPYGGARILFDNTINKLKQKKEVKVNLIGTWPPNVGALRKILSAGLVYVKIIFKLIFQENDLILFFGSNNGVLFFGPLVYFLARLFNKPIGYRVFGGSFDKSYEKLSNLGEKIARKTIFKSDFLLLETKNLVDCFKSTAEKVRWHSNNRPLKEKRKGQGKCQKFVFLGWVSKVKGIEAILALEEKVAKEITVDIYGKCKGEYSPQLFKRFDQVRYKGVVEPQDVIETLQEYDALLLPTNYENEGYPGVILEAYSIGMPVISTKMGGIPEIVDETSGILFEPQSSDQLAEAVIKLHQDQELYKKLQEGAYKKAKQFSLEKWNDKLVDYCKEAIIKHE